MTQFGFKVSSDERVGDKVMDHIKYPKSLRTKTLQELNFIATDAREAMEANPSNLNNSYYADEIAYVASEKRRREDQ